MKENPIIFDGSVAQNYDDLLGPFIFEPYALDLAERASLLKANHALELACGTGRVTRHLSEQLPAGATLTATDLNPGMIAVAQQRVLSPAIHWQTADMMTIPFADEQFDLIVCQFGIMFAPGKPKAISEMRRVLKKGGNIIFNTWGHIAENKIWQFTNTVVNSFLGNHPSNIFDEGPFCMQDEKAVLQLLEQAGFKETNVTSVTKTTTIANATEAAKGFILGLPVLTTIRETNPAALPHILEALEKEFAQQLGDHPLTASLQAWVFEATK